MTMSSVISLPVKLWIIINVVCFVSSQRFVLHSELSISTKASDVTEIASRSAIECACVCKRNNLCHRASYDRITKRCRIFSDQSNRNCDVGLDIVQTSVFLKTADEQTPSSSKDVCSIDWLLFEGNCYFFGRGKLSWADAQNDCNQRSSCLVTIQNERENKWLVDVIKNVIKNSDKNGEGFWIGANDIDIEDDWVWESDESKLLFKGWHVGQPNGYNNQDCVAIEWLHLLYRWNDRQCQRLYLYICEK